MQKEDCYFLGKITRKHGLSGNLILKLDTDQPEIYKKLESIFVEINGLLVPFFIEKIIWSKQDSLNILFKNSSEALVEQLIGKNVFLPLSTLPKLSGNQFYYHEVIGFEILEKDGKKFGFISFAPNSATVKLNDYNYARKLISELKSKVDIVIVMFHGGAEGAGAEHITRNHEIFQCH